jgi:hypothetical protein
MHALRYKKSALLQLVNCVRDKREKAPTLFFCQGFSSEAMYALKFRL